MASGFRSSRDGGKVRFYSRHGREYPDRLPGMVEAFAKLPRNRAGLWRPIRAVIATS
jgi:ATP-dependent DNA ligase